MYAAVAATRMRFDDIVDARFDFKKADEAIEHVWQGKQIGKVVVSLE
jgi:Zn-dependent alcohol dehydrogenase